jgi:hypothetical protein
VSLFLENWLDYVQQQSIVLEGWVYSFFAPRN